MTEEFDPNYMNIDCVVVAGSPIKDELTWEQWSKLPKDKREEIHELLESIDSVSTEQAKILFIPAPGDENQLDKETENRLRRLLDSEEGLNK